MSVSRLKVLFAACGPPSNSWTFYCNQVVFRVEGRVPTSVCLLVRPPCDVLVLPSRQPSVTRHLGSCGNSPAPSRNGPQIVFHLHLMLERGQRNIKINNICQCCSPGSLGVDLTLKGRIRPTFPWGTWTRVCSGFVSTSCSLSSSLWVLQRHLQPWRTHWVFKSALFRPQCSGAVGWRVSRPGKTWILNIVLFLRLSWTNFTYCEIHVVYFYILGVFF